MPTYLKDPAAIEQESFRLIRDATDLARFGELEQQVVMRLVHSCGEPGIADLVRFSAAAVTAGLAALNNDRPVLCDVEMVRHGLYQSGGRAQPLCFLNHPEVAAQAAHSQQSRSMTAIDYWQPHLADSIAIIGNAPTALFRLLEIIEATGVKPTLIIGMPVGFVGASESKHTLWQQHQQFGIECITLEGRNGGSALAAATFNTLARLQQGRRF